MERFNRQRQSTPADVMTKRPNFVFIITDQHRADHLGCYGNPILRTPHIDGLALKDNTIILFTADHGDFVGDHGIMLKYLLHYQGLIRAPYVAAHRIVRRKTSMGTG